MIFDKIFDDRTEKVYTFEIREGNGMSVEVHRKAVARYQATKDRVNIWMSPEGKRQLAEYAKTTPEKSMQKYLLRLIREDSGIDCDPKGK